MQLTLSRPPRRAAATIFAQSSRAVESFDFPDVGFDAGVLQLFDGSDHQPGPKLKVVAFLSPPTLSSCAFSAGTSSSNMKRLRLLVCK